MSSPAVTMTSRPPLTASGQSVIVYRPNPLTETHRVARAIAMAANPKLQAIISASTKKYGRPRKVSIECLTRILFLHAMTDTEKMTLRAIERTVVALSPKSRRLLGIPEWWISNPPERGRLYKRIRDTFTALVEATRQGIHVGHDHVMRVNGDTGEVDPCPPGCPAVDMTPDEIATAIVQASLPRTLRRTRGIAIDGTDFESFATSYSHGYRGPEGQVCADPDARWGKRTPTSRRPTEHYVGYELHLAAHIPRPGEAPIPTLCAGMVLRPGVTDRGPAALALTRAIQSFCEIDEALFDRGYTTAKPENFARPLRQLGIDVTMDLHTSQRGVHPGPAPGTIWLDGHLYSDAIPDALRDIRPPAPYARAGDKARIREDFDAREPYRFIAHSRHDANRGTQRLKGPAVAGHVRCPNSPASMRRGPEIPTTRCVPGEPCGCAATITVADTDHERDRQRLPWQSTAWALSYNRRTLVEGLNAQLRFLDADINHGFIQVLGRQATTLLLAFAIAGHNAIQIHKWFSARALPEPWQIELGEKPDDRPVGRGTRSRTNKHRAPPGKNFRHATS